MAGYRQKWLPPPTIDDYMYEVQMSLWWDRKDRAKRQLLWLMDRYLGDSDEKASISEGTGFEKEEGKDSYRYGYHPAYSDYAD